MLATLNKKGGVMVPGAISIETNVDHFLISTYENQLLFIILDSMQAMCIWEE
jgi:hypothetical protein